MFFECRGYLKRLPKYGRREQNALWRFGSYLLSILSYTAKSMAGAILEGHLWNDSYVFFVFFDVCFLGESGEFTQIPFLVENMHLFGHFRKPFGSLRGTFGRLLVTKVTQRLQKVSQKRPNGFKAPHKGSEKTI